MSQGTSELTCWQRHLLKKKSVAYFPAIGDALGDRGSLRATVPPCDGIMRVRMMQTVRGPMSTASKETLEVAASL